MSKLIAGIVIVFLMTMCIITLAQKPNSLHVIQTFHIASQGGWDYLAISPVNDWLYVSHGNQVNIINKKTGDSVGIIENTNGVHGIAFDEANKKGFISNGRLNTATVFDITNNAVIGQVTTGENPDAILYESFSKKIITCNGGSNDLSVIDPVQNKVISTIPVGGKPETAVTDGAGKLFVNIEDKNEIVVIDTKTFKLLNRWSIAPGDGPTGLSIDPDSKRLFAGCEKLLMVIDATNGKIVAKLPIGEGCDGTAFDLGTKTIFTSNGEGTLTVIHEDAPGKFSIVQNVITKKSARTLALDNSTHFIYLPAADFEQMPAGYKGRPKMKEGSFQVLVVGEK